MSSIAALVLAAGESRRFGGIKLLADIDGQPLLTHSLAVAEAVLPGRVHVVLGAHREALLPHTGKAHVIDNPHWRQGLSSSIAAGLDAIDDCDHVLLLLADQPEVSASALGALLDRHLTASPTGITCARYGGLLGIPAAFARRWFPALRRLAGDRGARELLRAKDIAVTVVDMPEAARDIDRPADLAAHTPTRDF
ncbi:MAG: nucleotidyltransferase family protein [Bacteroidales bacterium]|nr:nucleotidyltransferase family protein [Bacteroidales bacterium]